jgi:translation elongation factor EF-Tu-like GTPase
MPPMDAPPPDWDAPPPGWDSSPADPHGPALWMRVEDVFHIRGRGTVVTGKLDGAGELRVGDTLHCDGASWKVSGVEQFRKSLQVAQPGAIIGVLLGNGPPGDMLRGRVVGFGARGANPGSGGQLGPSLGITVEPKKKRWRR